MEEPVILPQISLLYLMAMGCSASEKEILIQHSPKQPGVEPSLDSGISVSPQVDGAGSVSLASGEFVSVDFVSGYFFYDQFLQQNRLVVASWEVQCGDSFYSDNSHSIMVSFSSMNNDSQANIIYTIETFSSSILQMVPLNISGDLNDFSTGDIIEGGFAANNNSGEITIEMHGSFRLLHCGILGR